MVVLGERSVSYEQGTPVVHCVAIADWEACGQAGTQALGLLMYCLIIPIVPRREFVGTVE